MKKLNRFLLIAILVVGCFSVNVAPQEIVGLATATATEEAVRIIHGPYLLGVTKTSIRVMWETDKPADSKVEYGLTESYGKTVKPKFRRGSPWPEIAPEGICLYEIEITGLEPDTTYHYRVSSGSTSSEDSTFKTLPRDDQPFKFMLVTDTHGFETAETFTKRALDYKPDFIMNCGDIPVGYGFQYDQFAKYFFGPAAELIRQIAIFHAYGNHDVGCFWKDFFGTQALGLPNSGGTPLNPLPWFSFNVGNAHFIVLDSNEFFPVKLAKWEEEYEWLIKDLESDVSKNATWRFIFEHHPYRNHEPVRKYIVPLMEKYDVDILWGGHTHAYCKGVSINPEIGARNMFMTTGTAWSAQGKVNFAPPPPRKGYPNIIAYGQNDYTTVEVNGDTVHIRAYTTLPEAEKDGLLDEIILCKEEPQLEYPNLEISPDSIKAGEAITVKTTVENVGRGLAAVALKIHDNSELVTKYVIGPKGQERVVALNPGESEEIETTLPLYDVGKHEIRVADFAPVAVDVGPRVPTFVWSDMDVSLGEGLEADTIRVTAAVQNIGSFAGVTEAKLYVDGEAVCSKSIILEPKKKTTATFSHKFAESGAHLVNVGDLEPMTVEIQGTLGLTPIVPDLSGHGNNGIMRGGPRWVDGLVGKAMDFDGVDDYVEVPDSESLHIMDGFTAIVWGNVDRLADYVTTSHSGSLLVKGPSTGWGPTYLIRMLFRRTGGYTSGTCYDGVEFAWEGGWLTPEDIEKWRQYISTYEKSTSTGYSYINLEKVAESAGGGTPLNYWEGYPLISGLAYAGNTDPVLGRGTTPTLLDGKVDEIRFYNVHLSEDERRYIYEHPEELGPRSENLVVWLSFDEIETQGTHTMEWRQPIAFVPSYVGEKLVWPWDTLVANASIPEGARITATIQVSADGETIKDSKKVVLKDGINSYDISDLESAQYIKIVTDFDTTVVDSSVLPIPKLERYAVIATVRETTTEIVWSTRADWEKGEMTGAVGFEPVGRLKVVR